MIATKEQVLQDIGSLNERAFQRVAEFVAFLKFQERVNYQPTLDEAEMAALYAESADEDIELAEIGMGEYATVLAEEDEA